MNNRPATLLDFAGLTEKYSDISFEDAFNRYLYGTGEDLMLDLANVTFPNARPSQFKQVRRYLKAQGSGTFQIDDSRVASGTGKWAYILGSFTLNLKGSLCMSGGTFEFNGNYVGGHDYYDFDPKAWGERSIPAELMTRYVNNNYTGTAYNIYLTGSVPVSEKGSYVSPSPVPFDDILP